jgi:hypothetical protein
MSPEAKIMKMTRIICGLAIGSLAIGCMDPGAADLTADNREALDVTRTGSLTKRQGNLRSLHPNDSNGQLESDSEADTDTYYNTAQVVKIGSTAVTTIRAGLPTLQDFTAAYHFAAPGQPLPSNEQRAFYYNRGDLGIGREMHCVDWSAPPDGQIACYVKNFAAGDTNSEFTFGYSSNIAFANMASSSPFATVAMVFRQAAAPANRVIFMVYDNAINPQLQSAAALDRAGILFNDEFKLRHNPNPDPALFGTPGTNFNNHIPSNCVSCHGGAIYDAGAHTETGSLFLPFDLTRFEFSPVVGQTRDDVAFKHLNEMVRKVAALSGSDVATAGSDLHPLETQLDTWYNNKVFQTASTEVFENDFIPDEPPLLWKKTSAGQAIYKSVIGPSCRGCHMANMQRPFATEDDFKQQAGAAAGDICFYQMPHALQTLRLFWQSGQPPLLDGYLATAGLQTLTQVAASSPQIICGPGNVATLDPQQILGAL